MTLAQMRSEVQRRFEEAVGKGNWASQSDVDAAVNDGLETISEISLWYEKTLTISLVGSQIYYDLDALAGDFLTADALFNPTVKLYMRPVDWRELDAHDTGWERWTGEPSVWFMRGAWNLGINPAAPSTAGTLTLYYRAMPPRMTSDSDTPGFPEEFHYGLVDYALYDLCSQDDETDKALLYWGLFVEKAAGLKRFSGHRLSTARTGVIGG